VRPMCETVAIQCRYFMLTGRFAATSLSLSRIARKAASSIRAEAPSSQSCPLGTLRSQWTDHLRLTLTT
jgi:hypothetical protein